jgi:2-methylcitrate dehydratase
VIDFNDTGRDPGHPSDNIPAMLSVADYASANGRDLITSIVLGYEIQQQLG